MAGASLWLLLGLLAGSARAQPDASAAWAQYGRTGSHSSAAPFAGPGPAAPTLKWRAALGGGVLAGAVVARSGAVVVGSLDGRVQALSNATGATLWSFDCASPVTGSPGGGGGRGWGAAPSA